MTVYTIEKWKSDKTFKAAPGQEITAEVYNEMLYCVPPEDLPGGKAYQAAQDYNIQVHAGFLMGEPASNGPDGPLYYAFGSNNYGKETKYYYLGLSTAEPVFS